MRSKTYECRTCHKTFRAQRRVDVCSSACGEKAQHPLKGPKAVKITAGSARRR